MRRLLHWLSPWHRGYRKGYDQALRNVEAGTKMSIDVATHFSEQSVEDAARRMARALGGRL